MSSTNRDKINSKLIELIKPHELLYNAKRANHKYFKDRRELWNQITTKMNQTFKLKSRKSSSAT